LPIYKKKRKRFFFFIADFGPYLSEPIFFIFYTIGGFDRFFDGNLINEQKKSQIYPFISITGRP